MDNETLKTLIDLARKSDALQIVRETKNGNMLYRDSNGCVESITLPPDPRAHKALDLSAIAEFASGNISPAIPAIWYSRTGVICLIDDVTRRDRVTLDLSFSPQLKYLMACETNQKPHKQPEMVLTLRTTLTGCFSDDVSAQLLPAIRAIKFTRNSEGESAIDHGKASIGKRLTEQATGAVAIPEYVTFTVPIFSSAFAFAGSIKCAVDVNASDETFRLIPLPLQIENAIAIAENAIAQKLGTMFDSLELTPPIRYGTP